MNDRVIGLGGGGQTTVLCDRSSCRTLNFVPCACGDGCPVSVIRGTLCFRGVRASVVPYSGAASFDKCSVLIVPPLCITASRLLLTVSRFMRSNKRIMVVRGDNCYGRRSTIQTALTPKPLHGTYNFRCRRFSAVNSLSLGSGPFRLRKGGRVDS